MEINTSRHGSAERVRECTRPEALAWRALNGIARQWLSAIDLAREARVSKDTLQRYLRRWVALGLLERRQGFPEYRYRLVEARSGEAIGAARRLEEAFEIFGLEGERR